VWARDAGCCCQRDLRHSLNCLVFNNVVSPRKRQRRPQHTFPGSIHKRLLYVKLKHTARASMCARKTTKRAPRAFRAHCRKGKNAACREPISKFVRTVLLLPPPGACFVLLVHRIRVRQHCWLGYPMVGSTCSGSPSSWTAILSVLCHSRYALPHFHAVPCRYITNQGSYPLFACSAQAL